MVYLLSKTVTNPVFISLMDEGGEEVTEFEEVYRLYFQDVYKYALSLTRDEHIAEEITQETFFKALRSIDQFDGRCKVYVWLCQIAKNTYFIRQTCIPNPDAGLFFCVWGEITTFHRQPCVSNLSPRFSS